MELISKVSKGSRMDQIYIPKNREGLQIGEYVVIRLLDTKEKTEIKPIYYNISRLEPIKVEIIKEVFKSIEADNVIITGSFLDKGFRFNDIDLMIITEKIINEQTIKEKLRRITGAEIHFIVIGSKALASGLETDPLYRLMLSKCVSKKRIIYKPTIRLNYKLLDLHLLKNELLLNNFDILTGAEKYKMTRNLVAISLFIKKKEGITIDNSINIYFGQGTAEKLKDNLVSKKPFLGDYEKLYKETKNAVLRGIKNESKQKQAD